MMEESEKRRERLKAMRMEAAQAGGNGDRETTGLSPASLSNPLIESETNSATQLQYTSPRFDYYTDPMSAFTGSKTRDYRSPQVSQGYYNNIPPRTGYQGPSPIPAHQNPVVNSPGQRTFPVPGHYNQGPHGSPMEVGDPSGRLPGNPYSPASQNPVVNSPGQRSFPASGQFDPGPHGGPMEGARPFGRPQGNPPGSWGRSGGLYHSTPNLYRNDMITSHNVGQKDSPYLGHGGGRGQRYNYSSHNDTGRGGNRFFDSGRGRGRSGGSSTNFGSGPIGRRGANAHNSVSAEMQPNLYYKKEMVEDPWKELKPVIWKGVEALDSNKSWLPKSISMKKPKVSSESWKTSSSQPSLAEYLAASFSDSIDEAVGDEQDS